MTNSVEPIGRHARTTIVVENTTTVKKSIEVSAWIAHLAHGGEESLAAADDDILVFPPAATLAPGAIQKIQIQYVGDPEISASRLYRVKVEELSVKRNNGPISVDVNYVFNTMLHVVPEQSRPKVRVIGVKPASTANAYKVEIENYGSRYASMQESTWFLKSETGETTLDSRLLQQYLKGNLVLPNSKREFELQLPQDSNLGNANLTLEIE